MYTFTETIYLSNTASLDTFILLSYIRTKRNGLQLSAVPVFIDRACVCACVMLKVEG